MNYKVKLDDIDNFLKANGYDWQSKVATKPYDDYQVKVTNKNLFLYFESENELSLSEMQVIKNDELVETEIEVGDYKFILVECAFGNAKEQVDLSKNWIKYLLQTYPDYAKSFENWINNQKTEKCNSYYQKIEMLQNALEKCKKQYDKELNTLIEYDSIIADYKKTCKKTCKQDEQSL